jgi:bis(5'-nucleosyl)-tetraphosphatase (symmetrical)
VSTTWVVGDIHGCLEQFEQLLQLISFRQGTDRLILAGDLVDRGPDSAGVVRRARELGAICVVGNHDEKYIRFARHEAKRKADPSYKNPMKFKDDMLATAALLTEDDLAYLQAMPLTYRLGPKLVVAHAGLEGDRSFAEQSGAVIRIRYADGAGKMANTNDPTIVPEGGVYWTKRWKGPESVIYGHNVHSLKDPEIYESAPGVFTYGIDTGCAFGGRLTAMNAETREFAQVQAWRAWAKLWKPGQGRED